MKLRKKIAACLFAIALMTISVSSVSAASNDNVINISGDQSSDYVGIKIDGNYDDWTDKPHSKIQYPWDTGNHYHLGALFRDKDYVYLHIDMSNSSYTQFNGYNYRFTIDGKEQYVVAVPPDNQSINSNGQTKLLIRNQNGYGIIKGGEGVLSRFNGRQDQWELKIPLSFFSSDTASIKTITFYCSNLGPQELIATGTPTLPFIISGIGLVFASAGYGLSKRKKNKCQS